MSDSEAPDDEPSDEPEESARSPAAPRIVPAGDTPDTGRREGEVYDWTESTVVDIGQRAAEIRETDIPLITEKLDELVNAAGDVMMYSDDFIAMQEEAQSLYETRAKLEHRARLLGACAKAWRGGEFHLRKNLPFHQVQAARDDIVGMTVASGESRERASTKEGAYELKALMYGVVKKPPGCPPLNSDEFPWQVGEYLYRVFDNLNSTGDVSLGNFSLAEALDRSTDGRSSKT